MPDCRECFNCRVKLPLHPWRFSRLPEPFNRRIIYDHHQAGPVRCRKGHWWSDKQAMEWIYNTLYRVNEAVGPRTYPDSCPDFEGE